MIWTTRAGPPLVLAVIVFAAHVNGQMGCSDSRWSIPTSVSLLDEGNFDLDEYLPVLQARGFYFSEQVNGHYYTVYPFGTSILAAPGVAVLRPVFDALFRVRPSLRDVMARAAYERGCPPVAGEPVISLHSWTEQIIASGIVAATTVVVYAIARTELGVAGASMIALVFAFGTSAWSTASRSLWQHGPSMLMLALALLAQLRRWSLVLVGLALGFAYVVRPTDIIPLVLTAAWVAYERPRDFWRFGLGVAAILVPFFANNQRIYGAWLSPYYHPGTFLGNPFFAEALAGSLISPARGLFLYSPVLMFAALGVGLKIRRGRFTTLDASLIACIVTHVVVNAYVNRLWWGGYSYGPRLLSDMLPYFMYFLVPAIRWIFADGQHPRPAAAAAFAVTVGVSVFMNAVGVFDKPAIAWNTVNDIDRNPVRLWDWRHPPFLARWAPAPPEPRIDIDAVRCDAAPASPSDLTLVSNSRNTLTGTWRASPGPVALYVVESGARPGSSEFPAREVPATDAPSITIYRVPPGKYYARVRAKNACGLSQPSNEIEVVVQ
jgi:hypothetical protein